MRGSPGVFIVSVIVFITIVAMIVVGPAAVLATGFGFIVYAALFIVPVLAIYGAFRLVRFFVNIVMKAMGFEGDD